MKRNKKYLHFGSGLETEYWNVSWKSFISYTIWSKNTFYISVCWSNSAPPAKYNIFPSLPLSRHQFTWLLTRFNGRIKTHIHPNTWNPRWIVIGLWSLILEWNQHYFEVHVLRETGIEDWQMATTMAAAEASLTTTTATAPLKALELGRWCFHAWQEDIPISPSFWFAKVQLFNSWLLSKVAPFCEQNMDFYVNSCFYIKPHIRWVHCKVVIVAPKVPCSRALGRRHFHAWPQRIWFLSHRLLRWSNGQIFDMVVCIPDLWQWVSWKCICMSGKW